MKLSAAELLERIEKGEDLEAISLSLISPAEQGLLRCCAIVRSFNEELVDTCFRPHVPGADRDSVPFTRLIDHDFVQRVPRTDGDYYLTAAMQKQYYDEWWKLSEQNVSRSEVPKALREVSTTLARYYETLGEEAKLDLLAQEIFIDRDHAGDCFKELYRSVDDAFDLARSRDLINILRGRENVLGPTLAKALNDTDRYFEARSRWATEYYQTVNYYDRRELSKEFESFLDGNSKNDPGNKWILHLHAPGGLGKTMFVRWLIARRSVPNSIPCSRIDFDFVDRTTASQHPWLLLLRVARELEIQIAGNFFHSLIKKFTDYERIISHQQADQPNAPSSAQLPPREKLEDEMLYLFGNALRDANLTQPTILILDTLEEIILYHPDDLMGLVRQVNTLRKATNILLVLSGRYDLTEPGPDHSTRLPEYIGEFGKLTQTVRVKPFDPQEASAFLEKRGLTKERPLDAVIERADGNPFKLALFADILLDDPNISAEKIRSYPSADLLYLIERVLSRIPNKTLHWLLRYGVVPRKLTLSFVKEVMKKYLVQAVSGDATQDDPARHKLLSESESAQKTVQEKQIFLRTAVSTEAVDLDVDKLWTELQNYASTYAWVTMEPSDPYTVVFHGDVVNPMRRWLENEPVYDLLHKDAIAYFENKAQTDSKDWARWMRDAVYHKFQLEGATAAEYWRNLMAGEEDPTRRRDLAREIIGSEYVDENLKPRLLLGGKKIIEEGTLADAYCELARASVGIARARKLPADDQLWSEADFDLSRCEQLQRELPTPAVSLANVAAVRAAIFTVQGRAEEAIALVQEELKKNPDERACLRLEGELANAYASRGNYAEASRYWRSALEKAERIKISTRFIVETRRRLATLLLAEYDFEASAAELETALDFVGPNDVETRNAIVDELTGFYIKTGQFSRAKQNRYKPDVPSDVSSVLTQMQYAYNSSNVQLALGDPLRALESNRSTTKTLVAHFYKIEEESRDLRNTLSIQCQEQLGMIMSVLREVEQARAAFESARGRWREIGNTKAAKQCMLKKADLFLTQAGDVREARGILAEATRLTIDYDREQWLEETLLRLMILNLENEPGLFDEFQKVEQRAIAENWKPLLRAKLILGTGAWRLSPKNIDAASKFFSDLADVLKEIHPASMRMLLLDPLRDYPSFDEIDYRVAEKIIALFPLDADAHRDDFIVNAPKVAELLRVLARRDQALAVINHVRKDASDKSFAARALMLTRVKILRPAIKSSELGQYADQFLAEFANFPTLCGSTLVELLEPTRVSSTSLRLLDKAEELLKGESGESQWMARLFALRGKLNLGPRREQDAPYQLRRAISIHESLGNKLAAGTLEDFMNSSDLRTYAPVATKSRTKAPSVSDPTAARTITIRVRENWTEALTIETAFPGADAESLKVPIEPESLLETLLAFQTYENYSFSFLTQMNQNWIETCTGLGKILLSQPQAEKLKTYQATADVHPDLCLMIDALQLSSAPWELMVLPSQFDAPASVAPALKSFYRALAPEKSRDFSDIALLQAVLSEVTGVPIYRDGIYGRETERAVKQFQHDHDLPPHGFIDGKTRRTLKELSHQQAGRKRPRVLLLRPGIERQRATSRGHQVFGFSPDDLYRREGFEDLLVIEDPDIAQLQKALSYFEPDVVHVFSTVEESTSIGIYLDFGSLGTEIRPARNIKSTRPERPGDVSGDVQFLTLSALTDMIRKQQKPGRMRPLLILDVLEPAGRTELFTQLLLRNAFAAQLYQLGAFESIIATGLIPAEGQESMGRTLVSALATFESVGNMVHNLRRGVDIGSYTHLSDVGDHRGPLRDPRDPQYLSKVAATAAIALFTQDPES